MSEFRYSSQEVQDLVKKGDYAAALRLETSELERAKRRERTALRDRFAGQAMEGLLLGITSDAMVYADRLARDAYCIADAMLRERDKDKA